MAEELELAYLVAGLRAELEKAREAGANSGTKFEVGPVEVEVTVSASKKGTGKAGVRFLVVTAETSGELSTTATQRIKLTLAPRTTAHASGQEIGKVQPVSDPYTVSGPELPGER